MSDSEEFKRLADKEKSKRKKTWDDKVCEVQKSFKRAMISPTFFDLFYKNLFFLKPELEQHFLKTKWSHQKIAIEKGVEHILGFFNDDKNSSHHKNIVRIGQSHAKKNMNIHPHSYYYWIDAMVMTLKELDKDWYDGMEYYVRECLFFPVSFLISLYHYE